MQPYNFTFPYTIFTDGAAKGRNGEGPASSGFVVYRWGNKVCTFATLIGIRTNNYAEYQALLFALNWALAEIPRGQRYITFKTDSELMVKQISGEYGIKSITSKQMIDLVRDRLLALDAYKIVWVSRVFNKEADAACNQALKIDGVVEERLNT